MIDHDKLLGLYPPYTKVLGPYIRKDGRKHIVLNDESKSRGDKRKTRTISYPKALIEVSMSRRLAINETVDHVNRDFTDDTIANLRVIDRSLHVSLDAMRISVREICCPECASVFIPSKSQRNDTLSAGPFCSRRCAGKYGSSIQKGLPKKERTDIERSYRRKEKQ